MRHRLLSLCLAILALAVITAPSLLKAQGPPQQAPAGAQAAPQGQRGGRGGGRGNQAEVPAKPTPRWPDGHPRLGAAPDEKGIWGSCCGSLSFDPTPNTQVSQNPGAAAQPANAAAGRGRGGAGGAQANQPPRTETPFQPWAKALLEYRRTNEYEPHTRCKPSGGARQFVTPYGTEIVEMPDLQRIFIFDIGGPHTFRTIYMDGKPHPANLVPSYYGDSRGHWEGDTLVVDNTGFNEGFWMDRAGSPHTEKLHYVERFTRTDYNTLKYDVTVDDPGAYTQSWTSSATMRWGAGQELFEYVCQDNNFAPVLLVGEADKVDRTSIIVP
jgi:hypothetical protein